jgi:hypothetical protein
VLNDLINNELRNLSIGKPQWSDATFSYTSLIQCLSLAYLELGKRFTLNKEIVILRPSVGITEYELSYDHADSNVISSADKYIADTTGRPFSGNIVKIDQVFNELGELLNINTTLYGDEISLLDATTLRIKNAMYFPSLELHCRALPQPIELNDSSELDTYEFKLPTTYLEALLCYAAGRAYSNRGAENATNNESAIFFARFEKACVNIQQLGLDTKETMVNSRFTARGFR